MNQGKQPEKNIPKVSFNAWYMMLSFIVVLFLVKLIQNFILQNTTIKAQKIQII